MKQLFWTTACALIAAAVSAQTPGPKKETVDGVRNFTNVEPTIACAGATEVRVIPELAKRGYKAIINLRQASEQGADIEATEAAAKAAGLRFIHLPLNPQQPDSTVADAFLKAIADPANQPTFINCASAGRVSGLMITKRMLLDGWAQDRAVEEAQVIGPPSAVMQQFALDYVAARTKQ
jgi:uncharacterized protein (TIGR01244 family)